MYRTLLAALLLGFLMTFSAGCAQRVTMVPVDPILARDCDKPQMQGDLWIDMAEAYVLRGEALDECTARMRALRNN
jgi:hypothetical protein